MAMRMGKACFTQKPLTHTIYEARRLGEIAREMKVATQMGNQGTAAQLAAQSGRHGPRRRGRQRARKFTSGPIARSGRRADRARRRPPCRPTCIGTCGSARPPSGPTRPAITRSPGAAGGISAPARWATWPATRSTCRSWPSICATRSPCRPTTSGHNSDSYPKWSIIHFDFPANANRPGVTMTWYDGGKTPAD